MKQLKLIHSTPPDSTPPDTTPHHTTPPHHHHRTTASAVVPAADEETQVYEHWRELLRAGRPVARVLSDERRAVLHRARVVMGFDVATMLLAVEGCAASAFCRRTNRTGAPLDDLAWIFGTEARIERLAAEGMRAREEMEAAQRKAAEPAASPPVPCPEEVRTRLADMRAFFNRRSGVR